MTLRVTNELKNAKKISNFWKTKAQQDASLTDLITPSPSRLSDHTSLTEDLIAYGDRAVDDLLKQLKAGGMHASTKSSQPPMVPNPALDQTSRLRSRVAEPQQNSSPYGRGLAPLVSHVFKDDVMASFSPTKRSKLSPTKKLRSIFRETDVNVEPRPRKNAPEKQGTKPSTRPPGKRKAILMVRVRLKPPVRACCSAFPSFDSLTSGRGLWLVARSTTHARHRLRSKTDNLPFDLDCPPPPPPPLSMSAEFTTQPSGDTGAISAEKALESLERICAGFSSGSLGSLDSFTKSSAENLQSTPPAAVISDRAAVADHAYHLRPKSPAVEPSPPSFTCYSVKTSTPLMSRLRQMRSLSRPSSFPSSQFPPKASSSPKAKSSPMRKVFHKHTSPLRITKRAGSATAAGSHFPLK